MSRETRLDYLAKGGYRSGRTIKEDGELFNIADFFGRLDKSMTSFDELVVGIPHTQIELKSVYPISALRDITTATNGTVTQSNGAFLCELTADADAVLTFRSAERGRYVAGYDGLAGMGVELPTRPTGNQTIEFGYTDFTNGYVVGEDALGMYTAVYRDGIKTNVRRRADWDNPSLDHLDPEQLQIYRMAFRWYGKGPMRLSIANNSGLIQLDKSSQIDNGPITLDPNQPLSIKIANNGTAATLNAKLYGRQFYIIGDYRPDKRFTSSVRTAQSVSTTPLPLIVYREKEGAYNTISCKMQDVQLLSSGADLIWEVLFNPTVTGGAWVEIDNKDGGVESAIQTNITATAVSGGISVYKGLAAAGVANRSSAQDKQLPSLELPGSPRVYALVARSVAGTATVTSVFNIAEEW